MSKFTREREDILRAEIDNLIWQQIFHEKRPDAAVADICLAACQNVAWSYRENKFSPQTEA